MHGQIPKLGNDMQFWHIGFHARYAFPRRSNGPVPRRLIRRGLKLSHLACWPALADTGQISLAARQLAMSQPAGLAASGRTRPHRGCRPLPPSFARHHADAERSGLAHWGGKLMRDLDAADRQIAEMETGLRGTVSIGAVTGPAIELVLPVLRQVRVTHPGILTNVTVDTSDKLAELMMADRLDFYIGRIPQQFRPRAVCLRADRRRARLARGARGPPADPNGRGRRSKPAFVMTGCCRRRAGYCAIRWRRISWNRGWNCPRASLSTSSDADDARSDLAVQRHRAGLARGRNLFRAIGRAECPYRAPAGGNRSVGHGLFDAAAELARAVAASETIWRMIAERVRLLGTPEG